MPSYRNRIIGIQMFKYNITMLLHFGFNYYFKRAALGGTAEVINPFFATDADGMQSLAITDLNTMKTKSLGKYVSMFKTQCDIRCDLHPPVGMLNAALFPLTPHTRGTEVYTLWIYKIYCIEQPQVKFTCGYYFMYGIMYI